MLGRMLVANRGEIAVRIIRAARQLGIETVFAHSSEDGDSLPARLATRSVCIGGASPSASYLNQAAILQAAISLGCDAIHPGYGFLSESASFAAACSSEGIAFIGPEPSVISLVGDKQSARRVMKDHGIPTVPGSDSLLADVGEAKDVADVIGYPVLLKATAGGGGRGMRAVREASELEAAYEAASTEAAGAFGDGRLYLERLVERPRHVEVQVLGDAHGSVVHLGERDCSMQRRNQKVIEESPASGVDGDVLARIRDAALAAARAVGYTNAGTVEFVLDRQGNYYFIEVNARIQVEHPVTEMVTGVDIVREQMLVASGEPLSFAQSDVRISGTAIECRINAEDAARGFAPSPGAVSGLRLPGGCGVRVETAARVGDRVSPWYDSLLAKLVVHAPSRPEAIAKMRAALEETVVEGVETNKEFLRAVLGDPAYMAGDVDTSLVARILAGWRG